MKITFLDQQTFPPYTHFIRPKFSHEWEEYDFTLPEQIIPRATQSDILILNKVKLNAQTLAQLPQLKFISLTATGYDNLDIEYCNQHNVAVSNVINYGTASVVEHTFCLIFALMRNLSQSQETVNQGNWEKARYFAIFPDQITEVNNKTIGIIGPGNLGQGVAKVAKALGMKVVFVGKENKQYPSLGYPTLPLKELLPQADILTLHLPLTNSSKNLITQAELALMKPSSFIINTSRGGIINETDLKTALEKKVIAGAGIDVLSQEPPLQGNPLLDLKDNHRLIITPHVAWGGQKSVNNLMKKVIENIENFVQGKPTSLVTKQR